MDVSVGAVRARGSRAGEVRFAHRFRRLGAAGRPARTALFDISICFDAPGDGTHCTGGDARAGLRAGARFLTDAAYGTVEPAELARMIGCFAFAWVAGAGQRVVEVTLRNDRGLTSAARLRCPAVTVERNVFGRAHVLHESDALGLYLLEVAPGAAIPAHFHRVMQEAELVLDAGLWQQGRPVLAGDAFAWPAGIVHEYRNPSAAPKRVLCVDRPKFIPDDEVVVTGPAELVPVRPARNYLA